MNLEEFSNEFDVLIDNARIGGASIRSLNEYDKSVFLTEAQDQIVKAYYESFEQSERSRRALDKLITSGSTDSYEAESEASSILYGTRHYTLEKDVMYIIYEWCTITSEKQCLDAKRVPIVPIPYDDVAKIIVNPFRGANSRRIIRIDNPITTETDAKVNSAVELIVPSVYDNSEDVLTYNYRYIRKPNPIILEDLGKLTIEGEHEATECELDESVHRLILDSAVQLALATKTTTQQQ